MGTLVNLPLSDIRRMALRLQDEERAFATVLAVLRASRRSELALKLQRFLRVRRKQIMQLLIAELRAERERTGSGAPASGDGDGDENLIREPE